jgi:putative transposase
LIQEAFRNGARIVKACQTIELSLRSYRRWFSAGKVREDKRAQADRGEPSNKLSEAERQAILEVCNEPEYASLPPSQIVPTLMDKGSYLGSESSFYRLLKASSQLNRRGQSQAPSKK